MRKKSYLSTLLTVFIVFIIYFVLDMLYFKSVRAWLNDHINQFGISQIVTYALTLIPLIAGALFLHKTFSKTIESFGFNQSLFKALAFCFICTLPMLLGYAFLFEFNTDIKLNTILVFVIAAGFFEEVIFRGFLFGQLYRYTKLGFIPAAFLGSILFGLMHLYQSEDLMTMFGIFGITFVGSLFFGWAYAEWKFNIWVPIFLHLLMNLYFELFSAGENALGGMNLNILRFISVGLVIALTVLYKKRNGMKMQINKRTILIKKLD